MKNLFAKRLFAALLCAVSIGGVAHAGDNAAGTDSSPCCGPITRDGKELLRTLDRSDVENLWLPRQHVNWLTGKYDPAGEGFKSHCSAFAAAIGERMNVYMLRPPEHSSILLANAQTQWFGSDAGLAAGWRPLSGPHEAQAAANRGELVVIAYESAPHTPGHIVIVRPSLKSEAKLREEGPEITQAGGTNHIDWNARSGFQLHPGAWPDGVKYFGHLVPKKEHTAVFGK